MPQLTDKQRKRLDKLAKVLDGGDLAIVQQIAEVEDRLDEVASQIPALRQAVDGVDGAKGEKGDTGAPGAPGQPGRDGKDGRDGIDGKDGRNGLDGAVGPQGQPGRDGVDGKDGADGFVDVATIGYLEDRIETVEKKLEKKEATGPAKFIGGLSYGAVQQIASDVMTTFESVSKNMKSFAAISSTETSITYANGITKTIDDSDPNSIVITLSGDTPGGIPLVKTITFSGNNLPTHTYS